MYLLKLVNKQNSLCSSFIPEALVQDTLSHVWVCQCVLEAFAALNASLVQEKMSPLVLVSGYRTYTYQKMLYDRKINYFLNQGLDTADSRRSAGEIIAFPGCSEHQLGLAIDVTTQAMKDFDDPLLQDFETQPEGRWLYENSSQYGFILRYPKDKVHITQITYEPWHYRYVGIADALAMKHQGLCLEEYIDYLSQKNV